MQSPSVACPACGHVLESAATPDGCGQCPQCGALLPPPVPRPRLNGLLFLGALLAPAVFSALGALAKSEGLALGSVVFGALVAGIVCGVLMGRRFGSNTGARVGLGIVFTCVFGAVSFVLGFFGCMAAGFNLNIH